MACWHVDRLIGLWFGLWNKKCWQVIKRIRYFFSGSIILIFLRNVPNELRSIRLVLLFILIIWYYVIESLWKDNRYLLVTILCQLYRFLINFQIAIFLITPYKSCQVLSDNFLIACGNWHIQYRNGMSRTEKLIEYTFSLMLLLWLVNRNRIEHFHRKRV